MRQEHELRQDMHRAERAEKILKDPLVVEYFENKRKTIVHNLETCKHWKDPDERDALLNMLRCLGDFEKDFNQVIRHGVKAKSLLQQMLDRVKK